VHVYRLPSGRWAADVRHKGQRRKVTGATRGDALRLGAEALLEMGGEPAVTVAVEELIAAHLSAREADLSPTTLADYRSVVDRIPAAFLRRPVAGVTTAIIDGLYRELARAGWSPHRVGRVHELLSVAWKRAILYGWATSHPVRNAHRPRRPTSSIEPPPPSDVARLLESSDGAFHVLLMVAAGSGARRGELVALQWADADLDAARLVIRRSLTYTPESGVLAGEGKTGEKGHRVIALGAPTVIALRRHRAGMVEAALAAGLPAPQWVFSHDLGITPWRPDYVTLTFGRLRQRLGLERVRFHDLRHYTATQLLALGFTVEQVAGRLGHSSPVPTRRQYAHWVKATDSDAAAALDALHVPRSDSV
jgi:integrase